MIAACRFYSVKVDLTGRFPVSGGRLPRGLAQEQEHAQQPLTSRTQVLQVESIGHSLDRRDLKAVTAGIDRENLATVDAH